MHCNTSPFFKCLSPLGLLLLADACSDWNTSQLLNSTSIADVRCSIIDFDELMREHQQQHNWINSKFNIAGYDEPLQLSN